MFPIPYLSTTDRVQTSAAGTAFVQLGDRAANQVTILNKSGTTIDVKTANSAIGIPVATAQEITIGLSANISEISVKRTDDSVTQVYVHFVSTRFVNRA